MAKIECNLAHDVGCRGCETPLFIPNWFTKEHFQDLAQKEISDEEFQDFINTMGDYFADKVSGLVGEELRQFFYGNKDL
jgi:hypothetical protein